MKKSEMFPAKYWRAEDLTRPVVLTVAKVVMELVGHGGSEEMKGVLYGQESERGVVLNQTRFDCLAADLSEETDHWTGATVQLSRGTALFGGRRVPAVAVKVVKPPKASEQPATTFVDDAREPEADEDVDPEFAQEVAAKRDRKVG